MNEEQLRKECNELEELTAELSSRYEYISADLSVAKFQRDQAQRERDALAAELAEVRAELALLESYAEYVEKKAEAAENWWLDSFDEWKRSRGIYPLP